MVTLNSKEKDGKDGKEGKGTPSLEDIRTPEASLYQALMAHYLHQDRLLWSRVQLLIAVQGAVLVAGFYIHSENSWLATVIMIAGAMVTIIIFYLVTLDISDRDKHLRVMDKLAESLLPEEMKNKLREEKVKEPFIRLTSGYPRIRRFIGGGRTLKCVLVMFFLLDIALALQYKFGFHIFPI